MLSSRKKKAFIITGLLLANILAFTATSYFFSKKVAGNKEQKNYTINYFKRGWQVINWSFSVVDFIKPGESSTDKE